MRKSYLTQIAREAIQRRRIIETEIFSVDERIKIISGIFATTRKGNKDST